ncbi:hypothetical protein [Streptantibioticus silvisoli]|uniref:Lipoprotein n=1 Tax=Streptantibioticus silvisoli TaxID=2705255 RepID=A0ABT6WA87_9ACTN|nr:hypothetical protein [Streptantibioticus silvisoli]MDI5966843.1 hypothetical protein [Streptantibioticus silvisoli]
MKTTGMKTAALIAIVAALTAGCGTSSSPHPSPTHATPTPSSTLPAPTKSELLTQVVTGEGKPVISHGERGAGWNSPKLDLKPGKYIVKIACYGAGKIGGKLSYHNSWSSTCQAGNVSVNSEQDVASTTPLTISIAVDPTVTWAIAVFQ